ncbi:MAG TPA: hypothetical protein VLB83_04060 [Candidatus Paceibacterota bacterium]|nr:hypothetical protein [Candidatus Paceibacterota bacterium]
MSAINVEAGEQIKFSYGTNEERAERLAALRRCIPLEVGEQIKFSYEHRIAGDRERAVDNDNTTGISVVETTIQSIHYGEAGYGGCGCYASFFVNTPSVVVWHNNELLLKPLVYISYLLEMPDEASLQAHVRLDNTSVLRIPITIIQDQAPEVRKSSPRVCGSGGSLN